MNSIRIRTHRLTAVSFGIHVLLLLWFILIPKITDDEMTLTEITWLEPAMSAPASLPAVVAKAKVTEVSPVGVVFMTFHFAESPTNQLTNPALDPVAKIPEFKVCAVRIEKNGASSH